MRRVARFLTFLSIVLSGIGLFHILGYLVRLVPELLSGGMSLLAIVVLGSAWFWLWAPYRVYVALLLGVLVLGVLLSCLN